MEFVLNMFLVIVLVGVVNLARYIFKIRKIMKMHKDNPNIQGISIINGEIKVIEKNDTTSELKKEPLKELVSDSVCGQEIDKKEAYRLFKEGKEHFFCSWECREKFLKENHSLEGKI
ncbi:MAG: hypothetical protein K0S30_470 [Clostridia bacterium]|jgi:YHS domain-containing protein|nr:hypothetical protein [Clostridia bacterium]